MKLETKNTRTIRNMLIGAGAGLAATVPMSATMGGINRLLSFWKRDSLPPRKIMTRVAHRLKLPGLLGGKKNQVATTIAHFGFGMATGGLYGGLSPKIPLAPPVSGVLFGLAVWGGSYFGWLPAMKLLHPKEEHKHRHAMMALAHVVWGASLGVMLQKFASNSEKQK